MQNVDRQGVCIRRELYADLKKDHTVTATEINVKGAVDRACMSSSFAVATCTKVTLVACMLYWQVISTLPTCGCLSRLCVRRGVKGHLFWVTSIQSMLIRCVYMA